MSNVPKVKKVKQIIKKKQSTTSINVVCKPPATHPPRIKSNPKIIVSPESSRTGNGPANVTLKGSSGTPRHKREVEESSAALTVPFKAAILGQAGLKIPSSQEHSDQPVALGKRRSMDRVAMKTAAAKKHEDSDDRSDDNAKVRRADVAQKWADSIVSAGINGLKAEFKQCKNTVPPEECVIFSKNTTKNRYPNIQCVDKTRFTLPDDDAFYIHANRIKICPKSDRFICTQAPLATTIEDFWKMVAASETCCIVMLCAFFEDGTQKCAKYFPEAGQTLELTQFRIVNESTIDFQADSKDKIQQSQLKIIWKAHNNKEFRIAHYLWTNWPDHGMPERFDTILALLANIRKEVKPIVVHCSAGVGRTGTFVLVESLIMSMTYPKKLNIKDAFPRLRAERAKSVQTLPQYVFAIRCALEYATSKFALKRNAVEWDKFNEEYNKFMTKKRKKTDGKQLRRKVSSASCDIDDDEKEAPAPQGAGEPAAQAAQQQSPQEVTAPAPEEMNTAKPGDVTHLT